jgi:hypothetical protein
MEAASPAFLRGYSAQQEKAPNKKLQYNHNQNKFQYSV